MTDQSFFFPARPVSDLSDAELMTEWFVSPVTPDQALRFLEVAEEMERRRSKL